ncbi:hypothetical protein ABD91_00515 [Lysinibacillus sphaericus]|uniref:sigma-70 family RNA polymerase sigma factor n=1 Tax=Lysinibacillus sphaericus TaxID=1421 RepID=UPI0018CCFD0C|nr:sigma-70 family RNA polymerase sigma factor [Lysinibacillus sphaericus]MBG9689410.1 hypothetical protein [Lysinibacillus sphaericus]
MEKLTNEELVELYNLGVEEAGNELFKTNKKLIYKVISKYYMKCRLSKEDIVSAAHYGFVNAIKTFSESKGVKFSTYCYKVMNNEIFVNINYFKYKKNDDSKLTFSSLNQEINEEGSILVDILDASDKDVLLKSDFTYLHNAIEYAKSWIVEKYHQFLIPLLFREITFKEVAVLIGVSVSSIKYTLAKFREHVREYIYHYSSGEIVSWI